MSKRNYSMIDYFIQREKEITPVLHFKGKTKVEFEEWKSSFRSKLLELLGEFPEQVPLNAETIATVEKENYIIEKVVFDTEKYASVPAYLLIPKDLKKGKKWPAILCPHGHGPYGKEPVAGITLDDEDRVKNMRLHNYNYAQQMAEHGFVTLAPDERTFGERSDGGNPYPGRDKCNVHFIRGLILGINLIALNIWDMMKCIDYLQTREEVDKDRIGCMGLSFGGTMTTYTAALNERVKAADIICYLTTTKTYAIQNGNFCGSQFVPHLYKYGDVADVAGLIAPRPLLVESGVQDTCFSIESAREAHRHLEKIYEAAGAREKLEFDIFEGGHQFSGRKAFDFFKKWL